MASSLNRIKYVYEIPYSQRTTVCRILDHDEKWKELAGIYMKFDNLTIKDLERETLRGGSPTDELLTKWGHQNHTVTELFVLLSKMQHYQAMMVLKTFVAEEFHKLIYEGEENLSRFFPRSGMSQSSYSETKSSIKTNRTDSYIENGAVGGINNGLQRTSTSDKNMGIASINLDIKNNTASRSPNKMLLQDFTKEKKILNTEQNNNHYAITNTVVNSKLSPGPSGVPRKPNSPRVTSENKDSSSSSQPRQSRRTSIGSDASSVVENCGNIPQISYQELMKATAGWDKSRILGKGGFGVVYRGTWKNTLVAIKKMEQKGSETQESYQQHIDLSLRELKILNSVRHDNVLPLYGYSIDGDEPCLVYQFMPNGSVEDRLLLRNNTPPLTWHQRHHIAVGSARGLQFLHNRSKPFIHGDIKSANILLDSNFEPRIGDFGLAREGPQSHYTHMKVSRVHGTRAYVPDEFLRSKQMSPKLDTYSFGIVLFELATGLRAYDTSRKHKFLRDHICECLESELVFLIDKKAGCEDVVTFLNIIYLGKHCSSLKAKDRPDMETVLKDLEAIEKRNEIKNTGQSVIKDPSPQPKNPYELQLIADMGSERRRQQSLSNTPTSASSVPPQFCNISTPSPSCMPTSCSPVHRNSNERYPPNYIHPSGQHRVPIGYVQAGLSPNNLLHNGWQEHQCLQREIEENNVPIARNSNLSPAAESVNKDLIRKLKITIPNPNIGRPILAEHGLLQQVKPSTDSSLPSSSVISSDSSECDSKEIPEINGNSIPVTVCEHVPELIQSKDGAVCPPISDNPADVPLLSLLGVKQSSNDSKPDVVENHESATCVSHHISSFEEDKPTAQGKDFTLFD